MLQFKECTPIYNLFSESKIMTSYNLKNIPELDIGNRVGYTDYIDFIKAEDMKFPIMKGVDCFRRPFLAIKVNVKYVGSDEELKKERYDLVGTIFQRYTDDKYSWAFGTCYHLNMLFWDSRIRDYDYKNIETRLQKLFNGEILRNINFYGLNSQMTSEDYIVGNGDWEIALAT
jgi:hypothetical protein